MSVTARRSLQNDHAGGERTPSVWGNAVSDAIQAVEEAAAIFGAGVVTGLTFSDNGDGTVTLAAGIAIVGDAGNEIWVPVPSSISYEPTDDNTAYWIYMTKTLAVGTDLYANASDANLSEKIQLGKITRNGTAITIVNTPGASLLYRKNHVTGFGLKVSSDDRVAGYLNGKLVAGDGLAGAEGSGGIDETFTLSVNVDGSTIETNADALRVKDAGITGAKLASSAADGSTLEVSGGSMRMKDLGTTTAKLAANNVTAAKLTATLRTGIIPLDLFAARAISANAIQNLAAVGGILASDSDPILERVNGATDKAIRVKWAAGSVVELHLPPVAYPPDLDDTAAITFKARAKMGGGTDTPTLTIGYFESTGDTDAGGATGALSSSLATVTRTIAAGDVGAAPTFASITITPGAHGTDTLELYEAWLEYTRA